MEQRKDKYWLLLTGYLTNCCARGCVRFVVYILCMLQPFFVLYAGLS